MKPSRKSLRASLLALSARCCCVGAVFESCGKGDRYGAVRTHSGAKAAKVRETRTAVLELALRVTTFFGVALVDRSCAHCVSTAICASAAA